MRVFAECRRQLLQRFSGVMNDHRQDSDFHVLTGFDEPDAEYGADAAYTIAAIENKLWEYVLGNDWLSEVERLCRAS